VSSGFRELSKVKMTSTEVLSLNTHFVTLSPLNLKNKLHGQLSAAAKVDALSRLMALVNEIMAPLALFLKSADVRVGSGGTGTVASILMNKGSVGPRNLSAPLPDSCRVIRNDFWPSKFAAVDTIKDDVALVLVLVNTAVEGVTMTAVAAALKTAVNEGTITSSSTGVTVKFPLVNLALPNEKVKV
jgi:hypothetical protein